MALSLGSVQEPTLQEIQKTDQCGFQGPSPHRAGAAFDVMGILNLSQAWDSRGEIELV